MTFDDAAAGGSCLERRLFSPPARRRNRRALTVSVEVTAALVQAARRSRRQAARNGELVRAWLCSSPAPGDIAQASTDASSEGPRRARPASDMPGRPARHPNRRARPAFAQADGGGASPAMMLAKRVAAPTRLRCGSQKSNRRSLTPGWLPEPVLRDAAVRGDRR
jgi:hypothetical protein